MWQLPWLKAIPKASESNRNAGCCYHISTGHLLPSFLPTLKGDCCVLPKFYFLWSDYRSLYWFESYDFRDFKDFEIPDFLQEFLLMFLYYGRNQKNTKEKYDQFAFQTRAVNLSRRGGGRSKKSGGALPTTKSYVCCLFHFLFSFLYLQNLGGHDPNGPQVSAATLRLL